MKLLYKEIEDEDSATNKDKGRETKLTIEYNDVICVAFEA